MNEMEELYKKGFEAAYKLAYKQFKDDSEASDIEEETMVYALANYDKLEDKSKYVNWVLVIAKNRTIDHMKSAYIKNTVSLESANPDSECDVEISDSSNDPSEVLDEKTRNEIIEGVLNELSEEEKQIVIMYFYNEMTLKEISEALGIPMSTVSSKFQTAKKKIKRSITKLNDEMD